MDQKATTDEKKQHDRSLGVSECMAKFPLGPEPNYLSYRYPHEYDDCILFEEETHTYSVRYPGASTFATEGHVSVSTLIHDYFEPFDADVAIKKMKSGRNYNEFHKYYQVPDEAIKFQWAEAARSASSKGTWLHGVLERSFNGADISCPPYNGLVEIQQFYRWKATVFDGKLAPLRTELRLMTDPSYLLTGTADLVAMEKDQPNPGDCGGTLFLHLIDWKFSKEIKMQNRYQKGISVCRHLEDTNYNHYLLQQNIYKWILEKYYRSWVLPGNRVYTNVKVKSMQLAVFHENYGQMGMVYRLPDIGTTVTDIMAKRQQAVAAANLGTSSES